MKKPLPGEKPYTTNDTDDDADRVFFQAHSVLVTGAGDLENAAETVTKYALTSGDQLALAFFLARFADFIEDGKLPPTPMREGFREVIAAISTSRDKAGKGRPKASLADREWARTHANIVANFMSNGDTQENAIEKTVAFRAADLRRETGHDELGAIKASESKIKRDYLKFRRLKK